MDIWSRQTLVTSAWYVRWPRLGLYRCQSTLQGTHTRGIYRTKSVFRRAWLHQTRVVPPLAQAAPCGKVPTVMSSRAHTTPQYHLKSSYPTLEACPGMAPICQTICKMFRCIMLVSLWIISSHERYICDIQVCPSPLCMSNNSCLVVFSRICKHVFASILFSKMIFQK